MFRPDRFETRCPHYFRRLQCAAQIELVGVQLELIRLGDAVNLLGIGALDTARRQIALDARGGIVGGGLLLGDAGALLGVTVGGVFAHVTGGFEVLDLAWPGNLGGTDATRC